MQTCSGKEHGEGKKIRVFVEEQNDAVLLGFLILFFYFNNGILVTLHLKMT